MNARVNALTDLAQPHTVFWTDKSKATVIMQFQERVEQVRAFFKKCRSSLAMVYQTMFPLNPQPETLLALMAKFRTPADVRLLVRNQLVAGAETAFGFVQARYPTLDLSLIANVNPMNLVQYYPLVRGPALIIIDKLESSTDAELLAQAGQEAEG